MDILNLADIAAVPVITVIAFLAAECAKLTPMPNEWLPTLCGVVGAILGIVALYVSPTIMPATDVLSAIAVGIVSGLAATGAHQVYKQLSEK
jgi:hypothetical protein